MKKIRTRLRNNLAVRLIRWFLILGILPMIITVLIANSVYKKQIITTFVNNMLAVNKNKATYIEDYFRERKIDAAGLAAMPDIISMISDINKEFNEGIHKQGYKDAAGRLEMSLMHIKQTAGYSNIMLICPKGIVKFTFTDDIPLGTNMHEGAYSDSALEDVFERVKASAPGSQAEISDYRYYETLNEPALFVAMPVFDGAGFVGALVFMFDNEDIYKLARDYTGLGRTGETVLAEKLGDTIVFITPLRHDPDAAFRLKVKMGSDAALPMQIALSGDTGSGFSVDYRGESILAAWRYLSQPRWGLVVKIDVKEVFAPYNRIVIYLWLVTVIIIGIMIFTSVLISRSISLPVMKLAGAADMMSKGKTGVRLDIDAEGEIGHLAESFNRMFEEINRVNKKLNMRIKELNDSRARLARAQEITHTGNWDWDIKKNRIYWSDEVYRIFGLKPQEFSATYEAFLNRIHPEDVDFVKNAVSEALKTGSVYNVEHRIVVKGGAVKFVREQANVIKNKKGEPIKMIGIVQDITSGKMADEKLKSTEKQLDHAKRLSEIGVLSATVAHELRNPLGVIQASLYNIKRKRVNTDIDRHLENIEKKVMDSSQIINNLLNYARIKEPVLKKIKPVDIINECIVSVKQKKKGFNVRVSKKTGGIKNLRMEADPLQLKEVFSNILDNAYDATEGKKGEVYIEGIIMPDGVLKVSFKDNGPGIKNPEDAFKPFFTTKSKGTGLGLAICRQMINLHGGRISIESGARWGTVVSVYLPVKR